VFARFLRLNKEEVLFVSGSDEHGTPVEVEALKRGIPVRQFADSNHKKIVDLFQKWNISYDNYTRTDNPYHEEFVQKHYMELYENGYVFSAEEKIQYCLYDKRFLPDRFVEGKCPFCGYDGARGDQCDNCQRPLDAERLIEPKCVICGRSTEIRSTKQWFFDLPKLETEVKKFIASSKTLSPNVISFSLGWIKEGLRPRSLTRDTEWGIPAPFPGAEDKTIYVWMEAVLGYVSAVIEYFGKLGEEEKWKSFWLEDSTKTAFFIGKDNIPFHAIIFPALLLGSKQGYVLPYLINSTEFLQFEGQKFSKSRKIGIWIDEALQLLPVDCWRYSLVSVRPESGDVNFTWDLLEEKVNSDLNDAIGNFVNRTLIAIRKFLPQGITSKPKELRQASSATLEKVLERHDEIESAYKRLELQKVAKLSLEQANDGNRYLNRTEPWKISKTDPEYAHEVLYVTTRIVKALSIELLPIIPQTAAKVWNYFHFGGNISEATWGAGREDIQYPLQISEFSTLFSKIKKKEIIEKLKDLRQEKEKIQARATS
jgi:methionyl-tRNA synthetase